MMKIHFIWFIESNVLNDSFQLNFQKNSLTTIFFLSFLLQVRDVLWMHGNMNSKHKYTSLMFERTNFNFSMKSCNEIRKCLVKWDSMKIHGISCRNIKNKLRTCNSAYESCQIRKRHKHTGKIQLSWTVDVAHTLLATTTTTRQMFFDLHNIRILIMDAFNHVFSAEFLKTVLASKVWCMNSTNFGSFFLFKSFEKMMQLIISY